MRFEVIEDGKTVTSGNDEFLANTAFNYKAQNWDIKSNAIEGKKTLELRDNEEKTFVRVTSEFGTFEPS